ncbi:MAG: helix-turn-helix domain-containing protein [Paludibacteraceae bacterium]|nr:helix-turn-helix domain-containing protein [Paludibacteraceae bacterium]
MLRMFFSSIPFLVCLCWLVVFAWHYRKNDSPKRILTWFLAVCVILYLCHALYLNVGLSVGMESLWALCSLSVYPLYYIYIRELTAKPLDWKVISLCLLPGLLVALAKFLFPGEASDLVRKVLFAIQVVTVCYLGYKSLVAFDKELADVYADMEGRETKDVKMLLVAFVGTSALSAVANAIGKQYFITSEWLVLALLPFAVMLYALSYIGFTRTFSVRQYLDDAKDDMAAVPVMATVAEKDELEKKIVMLMTEKHIYLRKNLKIGDLANEVGSCRTYVSNYINTKYGHTFLEYINRHRIEYAKGLMLKPEPEKMWVVADKAGFSSEQSFYRNFRKFVGMNPAEWLAEEKENAE